MRKVLVSFEISVTQSTDKMFAPAKPDYVFQGEFDKDDDKSFSSLCDLEYKVQGLVRSFKTLGCRVIATVKEVSHLEDL